MQASLKAVLFVCALVVTLVSAPSSYGVGLCEYLGIGGKPCGCGNPNCCDGCEPDRWIDGGCGCEAGCGCESSCGCEAGCGCNTCCGDCCEASCGCGGYCVDGRKFAGRTYNCGCESYMPMCACTGPECCDQPCGCGDCCEAGCGCESSCGCEASCGCDPCCKKKTGCCTGLFSACGRMCSAMCGGGSCGCSGEVYWSEWHNDPPRCCDPCNRCGQWIGPSAGCGGCGCGGGGCNSCDSCGPSGCGCNGGNEGYGGYGGAPTGNYSGYAANRPTGAAHGGTTFAAKQRPTTNGSAAIARTTPSNNPYTKARTARRPQQGANQQVQR